MTTAARRPPTATLFAQLLGLVVLTLVGAIAINLLIILNLPPPVPDFYRLSEIARVLKMGPGGASNDRRPLVVKPGQVRRPCAARATCPAAARRS